MNLTFAAATEDLNHYAAEAVNPAGKVIGRGEGTSTQEAKREALRNAKVVSHSLIAQITYNVRLEG